MKFKAFRILDEKEMYESSAPFKLDQLREIARFSNVFCFKVIWENLIGDLKFYCLKFYVYKMICITRFLCHQICPHFIISIFILIFIDLMV